MTREYDRGVPRKLMATSLGKVWVKINGPSDVYVSSDGDESPSVIIPLIYPRTQDELTVSWHIQHDGYAWNNTSNCGGATIRRRNKSYDKSEPTTLMKETVKKAILESLEWFWQTNQPLFALAHKANINNEILSLKSKVEKLQAEIDAFKSSIATLELQERDLIKSFDL